MSKKVWRGTSWRTKQPGVHVPLFRDKTNCTIIEDTACFPVREAMRFMRQAVRGIYDMDRLEKYEKAVAKMKARKGKK